MYLPKLEPGKIVSWFGKHCWVVLLPAFIAGLLAWQWARKQPEIFQAHGSVYVEATAPVVMEDIKAVASEERGGLEQIRSIEQGLAATTLLGRVIDALELDRDKEFAPPGSTREEQIGQLNSRVKVALRRGSRLIDISAEDANPERATAIVKTLVAEFEKWNSERLQGVTRQASEGLAKEEATLRKQVEATTREIQDFRQLNPVPGLGDGEGRNTAGDTFQSLNAQLGQATTERLRLEAEHEAYVKFDANDPQAVAGISRTEQGNEVISLVRALQQSEANFSRVKERYLHKHPVFREAANAVATAEKQLADTVRAAGQALKQRFEIARGNELKLVDAVEEARKNTVDAEAVRDRFRELTRRASAERELHDSVRRRLRETQLGSAIPASFLRWNDVPMVPGHAVKPRKIVYAFGGAALGGFIGCAGLLIMGISDRKIRSAAAAAKTIGTPVLVSVPAVPQPGESMVMMSDPASDGAEAFRRLRVVLAPSSGENAGRTIAFVSARSGEGKSFCALNYATSLAMQGQRTLLIDADLRSPGISRAYFQGTGESGLGGYLKGSIEPASACFATALPNLYLIASGPMRADAAELLGGTRFPSLLEDAYRWFDRVVIDTPAVLAASEALAASRYADRVCLVVREGVSDRKDLKRATDQLRSSGANLVGFVWNEASKKSGGNGSGPLVPANHRAIGAHQSEAGTSSALCQVSVISTPKSFRKTMRTI